MRYLNRQNTSGGIHRVFLFFCVCVSGGNVLPPCPGPFKQLSESVTSWLCVCCPMGDRARTEKLSAALCLRRSPSLRKDTKASASG